MKALLLTTISLQFLLLSVQSAEATEHPTPLEASRPRPPASLKQDLSITNSAIGYCSSSGGSTEYENISHAVLTKNPSGTYKLTVEVNIANPTGCSPGSSCPEYDNSPEYVNAWIDWNNNNVWEPSERVMDAALTGYANINYQGTSAVS